MSDKTPYAGLPAVPGVHFGLCTPLGEVRCPLCGNADTAMLAGKVNFSATMGGERLSEESLSLAAFVCRESHIFFLREHDVVALCQARTSHRRRGDKPDSSTDKFKIA